MPGDSAIERAFYFLACGVARLVYRVKAIGIENLPSSGCLLVPNHITWVDAIILAEPLRRLKPANSSAFSRKANSRAPARWRGYSVDSK